MMKILSVFLFVFLLNTAQAYQVPTNFLQKWAASETKGKAETGRVKIFQRFTAVGGHVYSIGSITFMQFPAKEKANLDDIVGKIPDAFGENNWKKSTRGKSLVIEGVWTKGNRYIRYDVASTDGQTNVSFFMGRLGYIDSLLAEARVIQTNLAKVKPPRRVGAVDVLNKFLGISEAQAGLSDLLNNVGGGGTAGSSGSSVGIAPIVVGPDLTQLNTSMADLSQSFQDLNGQMSIANTGINAGNQNWGVTNKLVDQNWNTTNNQIGVVNQTLGNTNNQIGAANQNWGATNKVIDQNWNNTNNQIGAVNQTLGNTNNQIGAANQNWGATNKVVDQNWNNTNKQLTVANQNWADTNKIVDKNWQETNKQMSRANDLAAKLADPKNAFTLAAATSAGMVFGATLANLAIDGVVWGARMVMDLITDASGKKERWDKFKEARSQWEKTADAAKNLEKLLDQFLNTQELLGTIENSLLPEDRDKLSRENLVSHLSQRTRKLEKVKKELEGEYASASDEKCEAILSLKIDEAEKMISSNKAIKDYLSKQNYKVYNDELFCDELKMIMGKLGEAEAALQTYRLNILNARDQWEKENAKDREKLADVTERVNDRSVQEKVRNDRIKNAESDLEKVLEGLEQEKDRFMADCKSKESLFANLSGNVSKKCEEEYETKFKKRDEEMKSQASVAKERKIENAKRDFEESGRRFVHVDQDIEDAKMQSYYRWFSDLEKQQHCFTHREEKDCKDLGAIKFMGPFYAKNAAKVKLKNICGVDQYAY